MSILETMMNDATKAMQLDKIMVMDPDDIESNPLNKAPITDIDELIESIRERGQATPVIVYKVSNGQYRLLAGERRWTAIKQGALGNIKAVIVPKPENESLERFYILTMNSQRDFTKEYKESRIAEYEALFDELGIRGVRKREWISQHVGFKISPRSVQNYLSDSGESGQSSTEPSACKLSKITKSVKKLLKVLDEEDLSLCEYSHRDLVELDEELGVLFGQIPSITAQIFKLKQSNYESAEPTAIDGDVQLSIDEVMDDETE